MSQITDISMRDPTHFFRYHTHCTQVMSENVFEVYSCCKTYSMRALYGGSCIACQCVLIINNLQPLIIVKTVVLEVGRIIKC